eukprot:CAMPEP_0202694626 /NCGR_PEP_ID=MMETSP1385-20130828/8438_1 /ASSEMBLY_ACC=CAM_ASM_000861 /TAXON_ID=933848 /ORGANISM="Elphidium margaritaceum" /LENGTH=275 /DNA_ID=CAMNT_0049350505 /DNA_START=31 /DNA_END=858 /DNA_ORIENTATION=-
MGSRLSEARRFFSILGFILLLITLFGSHLPWMEIAEEHHVHSWQIVEEGGDSGTATFKMTMYFNLLSVEACQTFLEDSPFFFSGQEVCSVMPFKDADKNTVDTHDWSSYSESCESAGLTAFAMIVVAVSILALVVLISTFKNIQRKCCPAQFRAQQGKAKCMVPTCAAFAPVCAIVAIVIYFMQCINDAKGQDVVSADDVGDVERSASGYEGFWIALTGSICLLFWWILFTIWFCGKSTETPADFEAGSESRRTQSRDARQRLNQDSDPEEDSQL